ncbi:MAG TPA: hypothetical protein VG099_01185 [Gemmataceae bacterium]|jgi:hypothetical protein|nr:hypothetical protein [Gemmataceae bacterium]
MNYLPAAVVILSVTLSPAAEPKPPASAKERLETIKKDIADAEAAFRAAWAKLPDPTKDDPGVEKLYQVFLKKQNEGFSNVLDMARTDPKSDVGFAALEWLLTIPRTFYLPAGKEAMELATRHHAANARIGKIIAWVGYFPPHFTKNEEAARALIKAVAEQNPNRTARGQAVMAIAWEAKTQFASAEYQRKPDVDGLAAEAEKRFEAVLKDYAECPRLIRDNAGTLGDIARSELFDLRFLRIGKIAPNIDAEDLDGLKFKLSDYRGKVVVLDFWGDW